MARTPLVVVPSRNAEDLRRRLHALDLVDRSVRITKRGDEVLIPVRGPPQLDIASYGARHEDGPAPEPSRRPRDPAQEIRNRLASEGIPAAAVPSGWERIGDVVVLRIPPAGRVHAATIARVHGQSLGARTVVEDRSGIHGPTRTPDVRVLWGDGTETVHIEGGVRFKLDVARVMFSSGNVAERMRIVDGIREGDVVVDLFAGIGYFALPIAVRVPRATVHACEVNWVAFEYLLENVRLNRAGNVAAHLGDCRAVAPRGVADWVLMGHFDAPRYLDVAFACLREAGTLVVHSLHAKEDVPDLPLAQVREAATDVGVVVEDARARVVKSYAPGIVHAVVEARVGLPPKGISGPRGLGPAVTR